MNAEWMIKIETSLTRIETNLKNLIDKFDSLPDCEKEQIKQSVKQNRRLIFVILVTYIPLIIMLIGKL
jgi:hypothetical protein